MAYDALIKYVRKIGKEYEYGHIKYVNGKPSLYEPQGTAATFEAAASAGQLSPVSEIQHGKNSKCSGTALDGTRGPLRIAFGPSVDVRRPE